ncbi:hypothetical protein MMC25_006092 [Agyrium rufum]|nr:hypothetical protein [Agyrium rufum]
MRAADQDWTHLSQGGEDLHETQLEDTAVGVGTVNWRPTGENDGEDEEEKPRTPSTNSVSRKIHFIGAGNVGNFVAHSLAGIPKPPEICLLLRRVAFEEFKLNGQTLEVVTHGVPDPRQNISAEPIFPIRTLPSGERDPSDTIVNLVVSTKTFDTASALQSVSHRLTSDSTIVFLQNGLGVIEEVNEKVFPNIEERPHYIVGVVSHGLKKGGSGGFDGPKNRFQVHHTGSGTIALGLLPKYPDQKYDQVDTNYFAPSSRFMLRTFTRTAVLIAVGYEPKEMLQIQLEKLAVNAIINPLTALLGCPNGALVDNFFVTRTMRLLLSEISLVIRSLPELSNTVNRDLRFSPAQLEAVAMRVARRTAENTSSMLQDIILGHRTEIEYINGYIVRRGEELGIRCVMNYMLAQMVKGKREMAVRDVVNYLPGVQESTKANKLKAKGKKAVDEIPFDANET